MALRNDLIRLAHANPELRAKLLPLLSEPRTARIAPRDPMSPVTEPNELSMAESRLRLNVLYDIANKGDKRTKRFMDSLAEVLRQGERFTVKQLDTLNKVIRESRAPWFDMHNNRQEALALFNPRDPLIKAKLLRQKAMWWMRNATIRLAYENPELRSHLLPLLKQADGDLDKLKEAVKAAGSYMNVGRELKKLGIKFTSTLGEGPIPAHYVATLGGKKYGIINKKYADDPDFVIGEIAVGKL